MKGTTPRNSGEKRWMQGGIREINHRLNLKPKYKAIKGEKKTEGKGGEE